MGCLGGIRMMSRFSIAGVRRRSQQEAGEARHFSRVQRRHPWRRRTRTPPGMAALHPTEMPCLGTEESAQVAYELFRRSRLTSTKLFVYTGEDDAANAGVRMNPQNMPPKPTDGELAILRVLWRRGPSTVRDVHEELRRERSTGY